ncbi:hypothetical protein ABLE91_02495 [Aquabacter sp. CN5-332]|uniref:hypothetical protein n=1 Tax=Aquabacter sp. CN5-332 TaxID=3156608 RepID=UPI0032B3D992
MTEDQALVLLRDLNGVVVDDAEARAAVAVARAVDAAVAAGADAHMSLDEAPWSFDTLRALSTEARK